MTRLGALDTLRLVARRALPALFFGVVLLAFAMQANAEVPTLDALTRIEILANDHPDRALQQLRALERDARKAPLTTRAAFLSVLGYTQALAGDADAAQRTSSELEALAGGNREIAAEAMLVRANALFVRGSLDTAAASAKNALESFDAHSPARLRYWARHVLGSILFEQARYDQALTHLQEAARLADDNGWARRRGMVLNSLATLYLNLRQYDNALRTVGEACDIARRNNDSAALANYKLTEANIHSATDTRPAQHAALTESLALAHSVGARAVESAALINLSDYYLSTGNYAAAIEHAEQATPIARDFQDWSGEATIQTNIGLARILSGNTDLGKPLIESALATYKRHGARNDEVAVLREYGDALRKTGQSAAALDTLLRERALSEELLQSEKQRVVLELQARYEADKREREITLLNRENALKDAQIENHRLARRVWWLLLLVSALAALIVGLLYRRVRSTNRQLEERNEELAIQSSRDPLTGLYNRRYFQQRMAQFDANPAPLATNTVRATYLIDIDHFKRINDRRGHPAGDAVLIAVAERLREALREADMIVRWGGEEFLIFVPRIRPEQMSELAQRIINAISEHPVAYNGDLIPVTASIGYAPFPLPPAGIRLPWEREINLIDMALYLAKAHGRSRAYGVARLLTDGDGGIERVEHDLEQAWTSGLVELAIIEGPPPSPVD